MIVRMKNTFRMLLAAMLLSLFALPGYSWQKSFPEKDYVAYLFTYFTGNSGAEEAVRYAVSMDGYTYWALNDNEPVIDSKVISSTGDVYKRQTQSRNTAAALAVRIQNRFMRRRFSKRLSSSLQLFSAVSVLVGNG